MIEFFMKRFAMSETGAKNLRKSIISHTLVNLTKLFPAMIAYMFIFQYLGKLENIDNVPTLTLFAYIGIILAMFIVMFFVARYDYKNLYESIYNESAHSRIEVANRLKKLPLSYFAKRDLADLSATIMSDIEIYETIFSHAIPQMFSTAISTVIISIMVLSYNIKLGLATLWVIPVSILLYVLSKGSQKRTFKALFDDSRAVIDDIQEKADKIQEIKAFSLEKKAYEELDTKLNALYKTKLRLEFLSSVVMSVGKVLLKFGIVSVAIVGATMLFNKEINMLVYIGYLMLAASIYTPIEGLIGMSTMAMLLDKVVSRIKEIKTQQIQEGETNVKIANHDIEFKDVHFGYEDYSVINGVSFIAKQGEVTALIGPSGSGKTTLTKLATRFWDIDEGKILLGGRDISKIDPEELMKHFSIVFQEVLLFNASVKDNIGIGKKGASDEEILKAARLARCDEFIERLPNGIDSLIGENGERLSGGERQRISIARALLKDAPIVLLDEATASLDVENESLIQEALSELIKNKTVIVIAHRMRTIRGADKIVLLKDGKIEASGTDSELLEKSALYKSMLEKSLS